MNGQSVKVYTWNNFEILIASSILAPFRGVLGASQSIMNCAGFSVSDETVLRLEKVRLLFTER